MKNKTPIICSKCGREFDGGGWDEITYHKCVKPIRTNAGRIRSMSDEELAKWIDVNMLPDEFLEGRENDKFIDVMIEWLKQEVE